MPGFKTHISVSTLCGVAYGFLGHEAGVPIEDCILAGALCSVGGILPDLDSESGKPVKEIFAFLAAVVPMMTVHRLAAQFELTHETLVLIGIGTYLGVRFGLAKMFSSVTVHRGMWHSIPAAAIAGLATFLLCQCNEFELRIYRSVAVVVGFMSHLLMDEIWSVEFQNGIPRFKKSFGTALKLWSTKYTLSTMTTYAVLSGLIIVARGDSALLIDPQAISTTIETAQERLSDLQSGDAVVPELTLPDFTYR